jgi:hypothetical protein
MQLTLQPNEATLLKRILTETLTSLREEIYKTENADWRRSLHEEEDTLKSLIEQIDQAGVAST